MHKQLRKSKQKVIFGVAAGVGEYFNIDPSIVRIIWILSILMFGFGLLPYLIMAIVMPSSNN
jgi:phage shock protein C